MGFQILATIDVGNLDPEADDPLEVATNAISDTGGSIISVGSVGNNFVPITIFYRDELAARAAQITLNRLSVITSITYPTSSVGKLKSGIISDSGEDTIDTFTPTESIDILKLKRKRQIANFNTPRGI